MDGKPGQIFHIDDSTLPLDPKSPNHVFEKSQHLSKIGMFLVQPLEVKPKLILWLMTRVNNIQRTECPMLYRAV